jgi:xanthine dehydrogenase/oxidase
MGLTGMEELVWGCEEHAWLPPGAALTKGPGAYKIPSFNDVPIDFRVTLFNDSANPRAIHSSRAIGEPPLFLGSCTMFAARSAIAAARADAGQTGFFEVQTPLTAERIRMACGDEISAQFGAKAGDGGGGRKDGVGSWRPAGWW